jgi:hypothetical protein
LIFIAFGTDIQASCKNTILMIAYFIDGTYMSMEGFNDKINDSGYTSLLENSKETRRTFWFITQKNLVVHIC